jgi:hypothetical protein
MSLIGRLALGLVLALALGGCDRCRTEQVFVLESPDSELQALVDDCVANGVCLPLCNRVLEISGQFSGMASIETCFYDPPDTVLTDAGTHAFGNVRVAYRPPSCS